MLMVERQRRLVAMLRERGAAPLEELAAAVGVSPSTVRRDLEALEAGGQVERTHGGAIFRGDGGGAASNPASAEYAATPQTQALSSRMNEHVAQKLAIGEYAASLVQPGMTLLMDGGSTVVYAARAIRARPIQVVTNSLSIANLYKDDDQVELLLVGGSLYPRTEVTVGPITTGTLSELHADLLLFSLAGIYGDGAFNINLSMARVEQVMMQQATRKVLLMDSSKFGRQSLVRVCSLSEVDRIVTDDGVPKHWLGQLEQIAVVGT
jgi:DeoR family fructose operon transcriptional repressor